jgi:hypothetical protein
VVNPQRVKDKDDDKGQLKIKYEAEIGGKNKDEQTIEQGLP